MVLRIKEKSHVAFGCLFTLLVVLLIARYSFSVDIPRIVLTSMIIAIAMIGSKEEILAVTFCCIPLHEAIDFYIAVVACFLILIAKNYHLMKIRASILWAPFMILWELLHCFSVDFSFESLVIAIVPMVILIMSLNIDVSDMDYSFIVRSLAVMSVALSTVVLLNTIVQADFDFVKAVQNLYRLGLISKDDTLLGGRVNPNSLGIINVLAVTGLLQLRSLNRQRKADYVLSVILIMYGVLSASRTFLVCLVAMFVLFIVGQKGAIRKKIRFLVALTVSALMVWLLMVWLFPSVLEYFVGRFHVEDITTGRGQLMILYNQYFVDHLWVFLFGIGATDLSHKAVEIYQIANNGPHNFIQEIVLAWGIPGILMTAFLIFLFIMESKRYGKKKILLNYIPLIIILVKSLAGQLLTSGYTMLALAFAYISLCQNFSTTAEQPQEDYKLVKLKTNL